MPLQPLRILASRVHRSYQGGAEIDRLRGNASPEDGDRPEEWIGSTTMARPDLGDGAREGLSQIELPDGQKETLTALIDRFPEELLGAPHIARYGTSTAILAKFVDVATRPPVHCHPSRAFASTHLDSPFGKTEAAVIVHTRALPSGRPSIFLGLKEDATEEGFIDAVKSQDHLRILESLNRFDVSPGDVYVVPGGLPHTIGDGVLLVEFQEPTDFTIVAEYAEAAIEPEHAHLGKGWDVALTAFDLAPISRADALHAFKQAPRTLRQSGGNLTQAILETEFFTADRVSLVSDGEIASQARFSLAIVVRGQGTMQVGDHETTVRAGDAYVLPAAMSPLRASAMPGDRLEVIIARPGDV